ncbi:MAG: hypothetical protein SWZ49_01390 [Cyanobacteriota bacterium]|nr:hypothetical protein [Cyanobacteriota bacterium]
MQLPSSNNRDERSESSTQLRQEVEQLSDTASEIAVNSEMQARIQNLLAQIKTYLQKQDLSIEMQRELARLLSLMSTLDKSNPQQIDILDLAISTLLENKEDTIQKDVNSNFPHKLSHKTSHNLVFIQEARRQIANQSKEYPHPFNAIIKGKGGAYNRLLSGLSWFFIIFVICPLLVVGLAFITFNFLGVRKDFANKQFKNELSLKERQVKETNEINNALRARLTKIDDELEILLAEKKTSETNTASSNQPVALAINENNKSTLNSQPQQNMVEVKIQKVEDLKNNIRAELATANQKEKRLEASIADSSESQDAISQDDTINNPNVKDSNSQNLGKNLNQLSQFTDWFVKQDLFFISLAVSMGALGSAISVIVRSHKFIEQNKEGKSDLFFTGFFRPLVGMSFAIFAVALIESGIFSGVFRIAERESRNVYLYMSIAFIAGFSERLVEDVVIKTENTLTGFSSTSEKSEK